MTAIDIAMLARPWLPTAAVAAMTLLGLLVLAAQPARPGKKYWLLALFVVGALATAASFSHQREGLAALGTDAAHQRDREYSSAAALSALNTRLRGLEDQ